jgi:UDP-N-acetylglucosamine 1-carboxyvinyltransferase
MGVSVTLDDNMNIELDPSTIKNFYAPYDLVKTMRSSILVLGPLLSKFGQAKVSLPGGCAIGTRPVEMHLDALTRMGASIKIENGYITATTTKLVGADINFPKSTVTGTENILMASTLAEGNTVIYNAAKEPEVVDLGNFLNEMGASITGHGTDTIKIKGVSELKGISYSALPDRIETGTFLVAL